MAVPLADRVREEELEDCGEADFPDWVLRAECPGEVVEPDLRGSFVDEGEVARLGTRHAAYGVRDTDYGSVGAALLWMFEQQLGPAFDQDTRSAWADAYILIAGVMRRAVGRATGEFAVVLPAAHGSQSRG